MVLRLSGMSCSTWTGRLQLRHFVLYKDLDQIHIVHVLQWKEVREGKRSSPMYLHNKWSSIEMWHYPPLRINVHGNEPYTHPWGSTSWIGWSAWCIGGCGLQPCIKHTLPRLAHASRCCAVLAIIPHTPASTSSCWSGSTPPRPWCSCWRVGVPHRQSPGGGCGHPQRTWVGSRCKCGAVWQRGRGWLGMILHTGGDLHLSSHTPGGLRCIQVWCILPVWVCHLRGECQKGHSWPLHSVCSPAGLVVLVHNLPK